MSSIKKVFIIFSAVIVATLLTLVIVLKNVKSNVHISYAKPISVNIFNKSTVSIDSAKYKDKDGGFDEIVERISDITNVSAFEKLVNRVNLNNEIIQDTTVNYAKWSTELKTKNIVIELTYDKEQDVVVTKNGNTRVISYWCLAIVIPADSGFTDMIVYYSTTNEETSNAKDKSYEACEPLVMHGDFTEFYEYINSL